MALTILIGGIVLFAIAAGIFLLLPAPHDSHFRSYKHLPGESPIDKLLSDGSNNEVHLPEVFNQAEVVKKLYMLQNSPSIFDKYVFLVWNKFSTATERQLLLQSVKSFQAGQHLIEANTEFQRTMNEFNRLHLEDKIKRKEADLRLTQLDADMADIKLRKATIKNERSKLKQPQVASPQTDSADDDSVFGEKQRKLDDLQKKKKTQEQKINNDTNLSDQERKERLAFLETTYQQEKMKIQVGFGGFEDD